MASEGSSTSPLIVIASNRGPFSFRIRRDGTLAARRGAGGLVTALSGLAGRYEVLWVASAMGRADVRWSEEHGDRPHETEGFLLRLIRHAPERYEQYYNLISNPLLWFIQHQLWDTIRAPSITREMWRAWEDGYVKVNQAFSDAIASSIPDEVLSSERPILIFPQDYHLYLVPHFLRARLGERAQIQPFLHIPWPSPDAWRILPEPMRDLLLTSMLQADRLGFQTQRDAFNFVQTCRFYLADAHSRGSRHTLYYQDRQIEATAYPVSVDVQGIKTLAEDPQTQLVRLSIPSISSDRQVILKVDRVEPSKNIIRSLEAYHALLEGHPELLGKVQMLALLVPSRMEVIEYQTYMRDIMAEAGMINARFSDAFWEPVRIIVGNNYVRAIAAMQRYDVLLINPIADGMNLVAKEGVLVNQRDGVLILSEHAGAVYELGSHALTVSPFDIHGTVETLYRALTMPQAERHTRAEALRKVVEEADVHSWFQAQLDDALRADELRVEALRAATSQASKLSVSETP